MNAVARVLILALALLLSACGYNQIQALDEQTKANWSEVINQYQRRADLVPNLVSTVKGYATHEERVLSEVTNARAKVGSVQVNAGDLANNPQALAQFQAAQGELSTALTHLVAVQESYPNLKADQGFRDLQAQLEGTENRISVARNRYIQSVESFNTYVRSFPNNLWGYKPKPNFTVANEAAITAPPTVDFSQPAASSPAAGSGGR